MIFFLDLIIQACRPPATGPSNPALRSFRMSLSRVKGVTLSDKNLFPLRTGLSGGLEECAIIDHRKDLIVAEGDCDPKFDGFYEIVPCLFEILSLCIAAGQIRCFRYNARYLSQAVVFLVDRVAKGFSNVFAE